MQQFLPPDLELIRVEVFWVSLVGIWLLYSLLAIWLATRKCHWFLKIAAVSIAAFAMQAIEASDLMLMQLFNGLTILLLSACWRSFRAWQSDRTGVANWKFELSLSNLLLVVATFAILFAMLSVDSTDLESRGRSVLFGCAVGLAFMIGVGIGKIPCRWAVAVAIPLWATGIYFAYICIFPESDTKSLFAAIAGTSFIWGDLESFAIAVLIAIGISGWIIGLLNRLNSDGSGKMLPLSRIGMAVVAVIVIALGVATVDVGLKLAFRYPTIDVETFEETQFEKLIPIALRFSASEVFDSYPIARDSSKRKEIENYQADFIELQELLESDLVFATPFADDPFEGWNNTISFRTIARALSDKARLELADGKADKALEDGISIVRLREPLSANMLINSELVSVAIEGMGHYSIAETIPTASRTALTEALEILLEMNARPNDPNAIYSNDRSTHWRWSFWSGRLWMLCDATESRNTFDDYIVKAINRGHATRRQSIAMLALELYRHDEGGYPNTLQNLVPKYLPSVPTDPFSGDSTNTDLKYRPVNDSKDYLLYSVGPDRKDNQGRLGDFGFGQASTDLNFKEAAKMSVLERDDEIAEAELDNVE
jgi:hypothetical protein